MKVWVTRHCGHSTAKKIEALGAEPIVAPLSLVHHYPHTINPSYDAIIITSANAISRSIPKHIPLLIVGTHSAKLARSAGLEISHIFPTVGTLIDSIKSDSTTKMLYLRGEAISADLKSILGCDEKIIYGIKNRPLSSQEVTAVKTANCVLIYSQGSGQLIKQALSQYCLYPNSMHAICISPQVAISIQAIGFKKTLTATYPNEESMMQQLQLLIHSLHEK